jgi:hypothetical protein
MHFTRFNKSTNTIQDASYKDVPGTFQRFTIMPSSLGLHLSPQKDWNLCSWVQGPRGGAAGRNPARSAALSARNRWDVTRSSPRGLWWPELGRKGRWRQRAAAPGDGGHCGLEFRRRRGSIGQQVAAWASMDPRAGVRGVSRSWLQEEDGAR